MEESCGVCGQVLTIEEATDWDTYVANAGKLAQHFIGFRCPQCNAVYCTKLHTKELNFKVFKGGYRAGTCPKCGSSLKESVVLLGTQASGVGLTANKGAMSYIYEEQTRADFEKHQKRQKTALIIAAIGTVWIVLAGVLIGIISSFGEISDATMNVLMPIIIIPGLGFYAWPFYLFHVFKRNKLRKDLEKLPAPGEQRFDYLVTLFEKRGWNVLTRSKEAPRKVKMQEKKRFNILLALFGLLFGLIGFFMYLNEYNQPGLIIELELMPEGTVKVISVTAR